jgi:nitroimidazol reductase NimA-like FMN-containing flavoprotein (pyridoxamine 5'-phosphate oxidase superfamily)
MAGREAVEDRLRELFRGQRLGVLASQKEGQPHTSLVAFAATADLRYLLFATPRATRKYAYLQADARVALLVDNRANRDADLHEAMAVTAYGHALEPAGAERAGYLELYLGKHPHLQEFVNAPSCALLAIAVRTYSVVDRFQRVIELAVTP